MFDVLVHGLIAVDYLLQLDGLAAPGEVRAIEREWRGAGGEAANCALALASWGAGVCLTGNPLGNDSNGRFLLQQLGTVPNLTLRVPVLEDYETPYTVTLAARDTLASGLLRHQAAQDYDRKQDYRHEIAASSTPSIMDEAAAGHVASPTSAQVQPSLPGARVATCDGKLLSSTRQVIHAMRESGTPLVAQDVLLDESVAALAEIVLLTDTQWLRHNDEQLMRMACEKAEQWGNTVVIWCGARGGVWCRAGGKVQRYPTVEAGPEDVLGRIGAGDVFRAGLIWARLQSWEWEHSLRFAAVAAALKSRDGHVPIIGQIEAGM